MANEFTISTVFSYTSSLATESQNESFNSDQVTQGAHGGIITVTTSSAAVSEGGLTTPGWVTFKNLDETNFVTYGPDNSGSMVAFGRINPGDYHAIYRSTLASIRWLADTASVNVQVRMFEA